MGSKKRPGKNPGGKRNAKEVFAKSLKQVVENAERKGKTTGIVSDYPRLTAYLIGDETPVEVANLPFSEAGCGLFAVLAASAPLGGFLTADGTNVPFSRVAAVFAARAGERIPLRDLVAGAVPVVPLKLIRVRLVMSGCEVELWNMPDTPEGRSVLSELIAKFPRSEAATSDYGFVPLKNVIML